MDDTKRTKRSAWFSYFWLFCFWPWWQRDGKEKKTVRARYIIKMPTEHVRCSRDKSDQRTETKRRKCVSLYLCVWISCLSLFFLFAFNLQTANVFSAQSYWEYINNIAYSLRMRADGCVNIAGSIFYFVHCANSRYRCVDFFNSNGKLDTHIAQI